jgi:protein-S-isoprenylcysteine O-methyltransferase Ste14
MMQWLKLAGWLACVVYSTIPSFWFLVHPRAEYWRSRRSSPYRVLVPAWMAMWAVMALLTARWRHAELYDVLWVWIPAGVLFVCGFWLYSRSGRPFTARQLGGVPEVVANHGEQRLVTSGIRARVRHPVYLAHLCEMVAWSLGTGLVVCWALSGFAMLSGAFMIRMEDEELEQRFGDGYREYRSRVPAIIPRIALSGRSHG